MASFARGDDSTSSGEDEGNANQKFDGVPLSFGSTRITQCGVLPLQCAGVEVSNKLNATCTVVKVKAHDRARLLFDLATFFQRNKHNVVEADVTTSPNDQMASDIFLIQFEGGKITKPRRLAEDIRDVVLNVEEELFENDGVSPKPSPAKPARRSAGTRRDGGDDETDSDFKETESELDLETESQSDSAKPAVRAREGAEKSGQGYQVDLNSRRGGSGGLLSLAGATDKDYSRADAVSKDDKLVDPFARGDGLKLSNVLHAGSDFTNATEISMEVRDRVGLLADVCHCLVRNNVSVLNAHIYTTSDGLASNYFSVRDARTNGRVADAVLEEMRQALAAQCHYVRRQTSGDIGGLRLVHEETAIGQLDSVFGTLDGPTPGDSPTSSPDRRSVSISHLPHSAV
jgi:glycine cleavage system regulatory protein